MAIQIVVGSETDCASSFQWMYNVPSRNSTMPRMVMNVMRSDPPAAFLVWPREARAADASMDVPYETDRDIFGTLWQMKRAATPLVARQ